MMTLKTVDRYFCSQLVSLHLQTQEGDEREIVANIEEIASTGAYLNLEERLAAGLWVRIAASDRGRKFVFSGTVVECLHDPPAGYYAPIEFDPGCRWSPDLFQPKHMVRADDLRSARSEAQPSQPTCCDRGVCPKAVISRILEPEFALTDRVRAVARQIAALCGDLSENEASACFGSLFGAGPECGLYAQFREAHTEKRQKGQETQTKDLRTQVESLVQLAGAIPAAAPGSQESAAQAPWLTALIQKAR